MGQGIISHHLVLSCPKSSLLFQFHPFSLVHNQKSIPSQPLQQAFHPPTSQTFTVQSELPEAKNFPSGLKETDHTEPSCPFKVATCCHLPTSHTLTVLSKLPEAKNFPSGLKVTENTEPFQCSDFSPTIYLPYLHRIIITTRSQKLSVGTEGY